MRFDAKTKLLKQVRLKSGGGIRVLDVTGKESVEEIKAIAIKLFFPEDINNDSEYQLGSYKGEPINHFVDGAGAPVSYGEYLKSNGLFSSRHHLYLLKMGSKDRQQPSKKTAYPVNIVVNESNSISSTYPQLCPLLKHKVCSEQKAEIKYVSRNDSTYSEVFFFSGQLLFLGTMLSTGKGCKSRVRPNAL